MRKPLFLFLLLYSTIALSQGILVDTISMSIPDLVRNELLQNACANEGNFRFSSPLGIGKFTNTNPNFPFQEGIIIRNGIAKYSEGSYTGANESSQLNSNGDPDLQQISNGNGQTTQITDVSFIEFDFTPISSNFSFDFLFASNEYGEFQCGFSDIFAFVLTDISTRIATNLAVIPGTTQPVSVLNIRDNQYNSSCVSANPTLFGHYNLNNPSVSAINMRGETKILTASSTVIPNRTYKIKLAIGDYNDSNYDSAVFIKGGSFKTTMDLGPDKSICKGERILIESDLTGNYTYVWTWNDVEIPGETSESITINQAGTYGVTATLSGCVIKDEITISDLAIKSPENLVVCYTGSPTYSYDLTQNNALTLGLNPAEYSLHYFESLAAANSNGPIIPENQLSSYNSNGNQTIYIKPVHITNRNTYCNDLLSFELLITPPLNVIAPPDVSLCDTSTGRVTVDLTTQDNLILNGLPSTDYFLSYFLSEPEANANTNAIVNPTIFATSLAQSPQPIWVRIENRTVGCFAIVSFNLIIHPLPNVDSLPDVIACNSYTLPPIVNGNYYTGPNGTGTLLNAGDIITLTGTYYIYSPPTSTNPCSNQNSFRLTLVYELTFPTEDCDRYIVPNVIIGGFFSAPGGGGTPIPSGTQLTTNQTIYYYAVINGEVCRDEAIPISVFPLPLIDPHPNVITCNSYVLPALVNGNYYTAPNGSGTALTFGTAITTSQTIYIFANDGRCSNQNSFTIDIIHPASFVSVDRCGSYTLAAVPVGGYYDRPLGQGNAIPTGTIITTTQTIYYYAPTTISPNCTDDLSFVVTIKPLPLIDTPANRLECQSYTLPSLTNGSYFTQPNGGGTPLPAGEIITQTQTIYVYASNPECSNEHAFTVEIRPLPEVDNFTDIISCNDFTLPKLKNGTYYTASGGSNGSGIQLAEGTLISQTQTIYIYNEWSDFPQCNNETLFEIRIKGVNLDDFSDISACDSYTLPQLTKGNYYSSPNGTDPILPGTTLTTSQKIYVYAVEGNRITCSSEKSFMATISSTPILANAPDISICGSYTLPILPVGNYYSAPNASGTSYQAGERITTSQKMYIHAAAATNSTCFAENEFDITIFPLQEFPQTTHYICLDFETGRILSPALLSTTLDPNQYTLEWYLSGNKIATGNTYAATQEGTYTLISTKNTPEIGNDCNYKPTTYLVEKSSPAEATLTVTDEFENNIDIIVTITNGFGTYEFQLNDGPFQTNNTFTNVASGQHTITIKDTKGSCDDRILIANVLKYPKFFTPNNDGFNDTWNINDLAFQPDAIIHIFDRYGKFIKEIKPSGSGWDGFYNGNPLPSTDYWFQVFYFSNNKKQVFKSHFSMKR